MKYTLLTLALLSVGILGGCSESEEASLYASKAEFEEQKAIVSAIRGDIDIINGQLTISDEKVLEALELIQHAQGLEGDINNNTSFVKKNGKVDFEAIEILKAKMKKIEVEVKKKDKRTKAANLVKKKKKIKEKSKLNIYVSQINNWGDSLVAIINIPGKGFETLSVYSSVGNGWSIAKIEQNSVSFVHTTGRRSKVNL